MVCTGLRYTPSLGLAIGCKEACLVVPHLLGFLAWDPTPAEHMGYFFAHFRYDTLIILVPWPPPLPSASRGRGLRTTGVPSARPSAVPHKVPTVIRIGSVRTVYGLSVYGCIWAVCTVRALYIAIWTVYALCIDCIAQASGTAFRPLAWAVYLSVCIRAALSSRLSKAQPIT